MSVPIATTGIRQYLAGNFMAGSAEGVGRVVGYDAPLTGNPNDLALTLNLTIPFILVFVRSSRSCLIRVLALGLAVLNATAVLLTFSRTGFLTLMTILVSIVWGLFRSWKLGWGVALVVGLLASLPLLPSSLWGRWATITNIESDVTGSAQSRRGQVVDSLRFVVTHPVVGTGIGLGNLGLREQGTESWSDIHNVYLQYAVELGLPGLGLYLSLLVTSLRSASSGRQRVGMTYDEQVAVHLSQATRLSLVAFVVAAFFHPVAYHFYFYFLAGLAVAASRLVKEHD
jgi:O-antigen ligase